MILQEANITFQNYQTFKIKHLLNSLRLQNFLRTVTQELQQKGEISVSIGYFNRHERVMKQQKTES